MRWSSAPWVPYVLVAGGLALLTLVLAPTVGESRTATVVLLFLLATLVAAARRGYRVGVAAAILANLLVNFFFVEGGTARARFEQIEVAPRLAEAALASTEATRGRTIEQQVREGLWVRADYGLLMQALKNLVENAARFSTLGTPIRLEAAEGPGRVLIRVVDSGPPIAKEDLPHLFGKFYRGRSGAAAKGTGLGLALVKAIVEGGQGSVAASSNEAGTAITLSLPGAVPPV